MVIWQDSYDRFIYMKPHSLHVMSQEHPTTEPKQVATDTFAVFRQMPGEPNFDLIAYVEVPQYAHPSSHAAKLTRDQRLSLAVARAVERDDTFIESFYVPGVEVGPNEYENVEGEEFFVSTELGEMEPVDYEQNPAFDAVWDPENEEVVGQ